MAVLSPSELAKLRNQYERDGLAIDFTKADVNAALQGLEDWWETTGRAGAGAAMQGGGVFVFTNPQLKSIGRAWFKYKFDGGG